MKKIALIICLTLIVFIITGCAEIVSVKPIDTEYIAAYDAMETVENGIETKIVLNEKTIADALKKQIPTKPNYEGDGYDDSGNLIYDTWICPNCGDRYELDYEIHQYCPVCGQRIDWSEED